MRVVSWVEGDRVTLNAILRGVLVPAAAIGLALLVTLTRDQPAAWEWLTYSTWIAAPVVGGLLVRQSNRRQAVVASTLLGLLTWLVVAFVFLAVVQPLRDIISGPCSGIPYRHVLYVAGSLAVSAMLGTGMGTSAFSTARLARRGWWLTAIVLGLGLNLVTGIAFIKLSPIILCLNQ